MSQDHGPLEPGEQSVAVTSGVSVPEGFSAADLDYEKAGGLVPGIVQHADTGEVLMVGFLDQAAVVRTIETGLATFFSRSRNQLWTKGETSGHRLTVQSIQVDCDADTLLIRALPNGPTCHTGARTCFAPVDMGGEIEGRVVGGGFLAELDTLITTRHEELPEGSYTTRLFTGGIRRIAQKVGEEGVETALAAVVQEDEDLLGESADLLYHLLVLLRARGLGLADVEQVLAARHRK